MNGPRPHRGFTLLELLVAIAIFAIVGTLALSGYTQLQRQSEYADQRFERTREVQRAVQVMSLDMEQLEPRSIREPLGEARLPSVMAGEASEYALQFTRAGWSNTAGLQRSSLQRVGYRLDGQDLWRDHWPALDRTLTVEPVRRKLLTKVRSMTLRFMDGAHDWQDRWPAAQGPATGDPAQRPVAVEITLDLEDWGTIRRVFEVPG